MVSVFQFHELSECWVCVSGRPLALPPSFFRSVEASEVSPAGFTEPPGPKMEMTFSLHSLRQTPTDLARCPALQKARAKELANGA